VGGLLKGRNRAQGHRTPGNLVYLLRRPFRALRREMECPRVPLRSTLGCSATPFQGFNRLPPSWGLPDTTRSAGGVFIINILCVLRGLFPWPCRWEPICSRASKAVFRLFDFLAEIYSMNLDFFAHLEQAGAQAHPDSVG
jgi:hypothetical protein